MLGVINLLRRNYSFFLLTFIHASFTEQYLSKSHLEHLRTLLICSNSFPILNCLYTSQPLYFLVGSYALFFGHPLHFRKANHPDLPQLVPYYSQTDFHLLLYNSAGCYYRHIATVEPLDMVHL